MSFFKDSVTSNEIDILNNLNIVNNKIKFTHENKINNNKLLELNHNKNLQKKVLDLGIYQKPTSNTTAMHNRSR